MTEKETNFREVCEDVFHGIDKNGIEGDRGWWAKSTRDDLGKLARLVLDNMLDEIDLLRAINIKPQVLAYDPEKVGKKAREEGFREGYDCAVREGAKGVGDENLKKMVAGMMEKTIENVVRTKVKIVYRD